MRVLVSGSHGSIGAALVAALEKRGDSVVRLVRSKPGENEIAWDAKTGAVDVNALDGFNAVVHLAGHSIGEKRWNEKERGLIWDSRIPSTDFLAQRLAQTISRPEVFITASAIGYYGNRGDEVLEENASKGEGFLADVADNWEKAAEPARDAGIRVAHVRTGIVLDPKGGILKRLAPVFRGMLGGKLGDGTQYMSWISLRDEVSAIIFAIDKQRIAGPFNACSPNPVTNIQFTKAFAKAIHRPAPVPVWPWMLHFGFGRQLTDEMLLASQRGKPTVLTTNGFHFADTDIETTLYDMYNDVAEGEIVDDLPSKKDK